MTALEKIMFIRGWRVNAAGKWFKPGIAGQWPSALAAANANPV